MARRPTAGVGAVRPSYEQFFHGERGARVVVLPQAFVTWLYPAARLRDLHARYHGDPLNDACLIALALAAQESTSGVGSKPAPRSEVPAQSTQRLVSTASIAAQLNITTRAVTQAIHDDRLRAVKDEDGRWRITAADASAFAAQRQEKT
jgi:hypothetical protein